MIIDTLLMRKKEDRALRVLKSLEEMGKKEFVPSIGPVKAKIIANIVKKHKPKRILEIGTCTDILRY